MTKGKISVIILIITLLVSCSRVPITNRSQFKMLPDIYITCSETEIIICSFNENTATANGGGIYMDDPVYSSINLNSFKSNTAYKGSALYYLRSIYNNDTYILNNLFVENYATDKGVVYLQGNNVNTIFNHNTVSNNTAAYWISGICIEFDYPYFPAEFKNNIAYESIVDMYITTTYQRPSNYLILAGINYFNNDNTYNPNPNPGFVSSSDYHLTSTSILCIDAGDNSATKTSTDLDGNNRIINGNINGYYTDYGCYEYNP